MKDGLKLCVRCKERPQRPTHRYCRECHAEYMREQRRRKRIEKKKLAMTQCPHCGEVLLEEERDHVVAKVTEGN